MASSLHRNTFAGELTSYESGFAPILTPFKTTLFITMLFFSECAHNNLQILKAILLLAEGFKPTPLDLVTIILPSMTATIMAKTKLLRSR